MKKIVFIICLFSSQVLYSQFTFGIKISGLAYHPQHKVKETAYQLKLDKKGKLAAYFGITLTSAYQFNPYIGLKIAQSILPYDCAGKFSSLTHIGINITDRVFWTNQKHNASISIGPLMYLRKGWLNIKNYKPDTKFIKTSKKNQQWQYKFLWYGGQFQYDYYYKNNRAISVNIFPGYPYIYAFAVGGTTKF